MDNKKAVPINNFKGGYAGNLPIDTLQNNQAADLDNIIIKDGGRGFRSRRGNDYLNQAVKVIQDLTYTAVAIGVAGESVTITYAGGGTAGMESVNVVGSAITITIQSAISTATQIKTAFDASAAATALASVAVSGTGSNAQVAASAVALVQTGLNSTQPVQGIGYLIQANQSTFLVEVVGSKFFKSSNLSGVWVDKTGSYSGITAGANDKWDLFGFQDAIVGFGGPSTSPDAPFTWDGSSNIAALGGTAPSAYGGFSANNRVFAFRTNTDPSTIYWSSLGVANDFSGAGSGSAVVGSFSDNQRITAAKVLSTNYVIVFKDTSTYQMVISSSPFPIYSLFDNVGCVGKRACVNVDGIIYFISSQKRMYSTNGESLQEYSEDAHNLWDSVDDNTREYIEGIRLHTTDYDWIIWSVTISGTKRAIIWDLNNQCWLYCSTGWKMNTLGIDHLGQVYQGGSTGVTYLPDQAGQYYDTSETSPGTITSFWRSGWLNPAQLDEIVQVTKMTGTYLTKASGNITISYGFDFVSDSKSFTLSQIPTSSELLTSRSSVLTGRGNFFQFKIGQSSSTIDTEFHSLILRGKVYGQKRISAS